MKVIEDNSAGSRVWILILWLEGCESLLLLFSVPDWGADTGNSGWPEIPPLCEVNFSLFYCAFIFSIYDSFYSFNVFPSLCFFCSLKRFHKNLLLHGLSCLIIIQTMQQWWRNINYWMSVWLCRKRIKGCINAVNHTTAPIQQKPRCDTERSVVAVNYLCFHDRLQWPAGRQRNDHFNLT